MKKKPKKVKKVKLLDPDKMKKGEVINPKDVHYLAQHRELHMCEVLGLKLPVDLRGSIVPSKAAYHYVAGQFVLSDEAPIRGNMELRAGIGKVDPNRVYRQFHVVAPPQKEEEA